MMLAVGKQLREKKIILWFKVAEILLILAKSGKNYQKLSLQVGVIIQNLTEQKMILLKLILDKIYIYFLFDLK